MIFDAKRVMWRTHACNHVACARAEARSGPSLRWVWCWSLVS
jgi:hypothetical protein